MQSEQSGPYGFKSTKLANSVYPDERIRRATTSGSTEFEAHIIGYQARLTFTIKMLGYCINPYYAVYFMHYNSPIFSSY